MQKEFKVVRVKNRFERDSVEKVTVETLQTEFYAAETSGEDAESSSSGGSGLGSCARHCERSRTFVMFNAASSRPIGMPRAKVFLSVVEVTRFYVNV